MKKTNKEEEKQNVDVEDIFDESNVPPSNYFKFSEPGARIAGTLLSVEDRPAKAPFGPSRVYTLRVKDGSDWNVSIPLAKTFVISRAAAAGIGDMLGFSFDKEVESATKGFAPAKSLSVYVVKKPKDDLDLEDF